MEFILLTAGIVATVLVFLLFRRQIKINQKKKRFVERRYQRIKPFIDKLENDRLTEEDVQWYAEDMLTRHMTYSLLEKHNKLDLFPNEYKSIEKGAESDLATWLEAPNELNIYPDEVQHLQKVDLNGEGRNLFYHVFKFLIYEPHQAAKNGWMLGVVGPYSETSVPYETPSGTFSRMTLLDEVIPEEEAKWVHENVH